MLFLSPIPRGFSEDIFGIASSLVVLHRGAGWPSVALPRPMCQQRPRPAAAALACSTPPGAETVSWEGVCPSHSPGLCTYFCWCCSRTRWLARTVRQSPAPRLLWSAAGPTTHSHREQRNQSSHRKFINFILRWAARKKLCLHMQSWPRTFGRCSLLCGHRASIGRFPCFSVSDVGFIFIHNHFLCQVQNGWEVYFTYSLLSTWQRIRARGKFIKACVGQTGQP